MIAKMFFITVSCILVAEVLGHGMMLDPPNRSSLWRTDSSAPVNNEDNQLYCGGMNVQWNTFGGKCGVCGDRYDAPHPQDNENTGKYGQGKVVKNYKPGETIPVMVKLTTNHKGYFLFSLCKLDNPNAPESGEECFQPLNLGNGQDRYNVGSSDSDVNTNVKLPDGLTCDRCVLRWHYNTGNNWGDCGNGTSATGCGPQENFRSCSDISIGA